MARMDCRHHIGEITAHTAHPRAHGGLGEPNERIELGKLAICPDENMIAEVVGASRGATFLGIGWAAIELPRVVSQFAYHNPGLGRPATGAYRYVGVAAREVEPLVCRNQLHFDI